MHSVPRASTAGMILSVSLKLTEKEMERAKRITTSDTCDALGSSD